MNNTFDDAVGTMMELWASRNERNIERVTEINSSIFYAEIETYAKFIPLEADKKGYLGAIATYCDHREKEGFKQGIIFAIQFMSKVFAE